MAVIKNARRDADLSGAEKAAALLLLMGKDTATRIASFFSPEEINNFVASASTLKSLETTAAQELVSEFERNYSNTGVFADSGNLSDFFKEIMEQEDDDEDEQSEGESDSKDSDDFPSVEEIGEFLESEPDYIGVFLLSTLEDELLAEVFTSLDNEKRKSLFKLYMDRQASDPNIEISMRDELFALIADKDADDGSLERIESAAGVMNFLPEEAGEEIMAFLQSDNPETAEILKKSIFRFSEIVDLPKESRSLIFDGVEADVIVPALHEAEPNLKEVVLEVLSQRNRRMIEAELARGGVTEEAMLAAQRKISSIVIKLARENRITLQASAE